jgi:hypothetical protein
LARAASCTSPYDALVIRLVRVHEQSNNFRLRDQLGQQLEALGIQLGGDVAETGEIPARQRKAGDQARPDRVADASEDDRDCRGCTFRRLCRNGAWGQDNVDFAADEVGGQSRKPVIVPLRRTIFHRQVFSLNGARLA